MNNGQNASMGELVARRMACVLCARPAVVVAYESDFIKHREVFEAFARENPGGSVLVQLGWECETPESVGRLAAAAAAFREAAPGARLVTMCNSAAEMEALGKTGMETRWIHQNALMDERRFRPMGGKNRPFDAAYIARLTPFKRHGLLPAELSPRLLFLGAAVRASERGYADEMHAAYPTARWVDGFSGSKVSCLLAQAKCGLALSAVEGACFASAEYLLSGLPVVDTPSIGGRDVVMPDEYVRRVEPAPDAIAAGIEHWVAHRPDPWKVRAAFLAKTAPHRERFGQLMKELTGRDCGRPPHKLGLRTPRPGKLATLAIQAYLFAKGLSVR